MKNYYVTLLGIALIVSNVSVAQYHLSADAFNDAKSLKKAQIADDVRPGVSGTHHVQSTNKKEAAVDTAGIEFEQDDQTAFYLTSGSNVIPLAGTNPYLDKEFAQIYQYWGSGMNIEAVLLRFWAKSGSTGSINVKVYDASTGAIGAVKSTTSFSCANIDTSGLGTAFSVVTPSSPVSITDQFAVSYDVTPLLNSGGTSYTTLIGAWITKEDGAYASLNARFKTKNNTWLNLLDWSVLNGITYNSTGLNPTNSNFLIYPVVSAQYNTGIDETEAVGGIKLTQSYPNPTKDMAKITYEIQEASTVTMELIDATGKVVLKKEEGKQASGKHEITLNVSQLPAGNYFYALTAGDKRLAKKLTIE